ncbi:MAG: glycoside hydrolase family 16 protein [Proteobacteria bacterium]|nr:glycoside hydrolase family 16 protein [Pseudomonadota bacterium]
MLHQQAACAALAILTGFSIRPQSPKPRWVLSWSDEFAQPDGSTPDRSKWGYDLGVGWEGGWGNRELQYYTDRAANARIDAGELVITARKERFSGPAARSVVTREYTSARLQTVRLFDQAYGRFEARIKVPAGAGLWSAFWMMGADIGRVDWPDCGEIDVMEVIGRDPATVYGSLHGPGYWGGDSRTAAHTLPGGAKLSDAHHVYAVEWEPNAIRFYLDGVLFATQTPETLPRGSRWVFDKPFFLLMNLAVGGNWPGDPDATTVFPRELRVDYVRVYSAAAPSGPAIADLALTGHDVLLAGQAD